MRFPRWFRDSVDRPTVPRGVQVAAAWSWRFVAVVAALAVAVLLIIQLSFIVVPLLIAVLLAVLAAPIANWLKQHWIRLVVHADDVGGLSLRHHRLDLASC